MKTIFITGGAGFIGSNFIRHISAKYGKIKIINFDKLTYAGLSKKFENLDPKTKYYFIRGDIADMAQLKSAFLKYKPQYVINFAAETHVDKSIHGNIRDFVRTNVEGVFNILELVKASPFVKKFLQVSTDEVYGTLSLRSDKKFNEKSRLLPNSPYAASKASADMLCRSYFSTWGTPVVVSRSSNNYGPFQYPEKLIPYFVSRALRKKTLPLYGDGKNVRDWVYVLDNCRALELCLFKGRPGEIYNVGAGEEKSNLEIARALLRHFNLDSSFLSFVDDRPGHDRRYALDSSEIRRELGWQPGHGFDEAFAATIAWYESPPNYWISRTENISLNSHIKTS